MEPIHSRLHGREKPSPAIKLTVVALLVWTAVLGASLAWDLDRTRKQTMEMAYAEARAVRDKDMAFRRWALKHQGVYVRESEKEPPSPFLAHVPGRDLETVDGRKLTLRAPATMVREMMDEFSARVGTRGRIVGLRYLNPGNAPDDWEKRQLEAFEMGERDEVWEVADMQGEPHLRHLKAWFMEDGCVKCHAILGYKAGDMRGATGVNLPLKAYYAHADEVARDLTLSHLGIWFLGLIGIGWSGHLARQRAQERRQANRVLRLYADIFDQSGEAILVTDHHNHIIDGNPALEHLTGYSLDELRGLDPRLLASGQTPSAVYQELWQALKTNRHWQGELWDRRKDGRIFPKWAAISAIHDPEDGKLTHFIAHFADISERKAAEDRINYLAHHDSLTGLANRYSMENRLDQALATTRRAALPLAVMMIDMDRFKSINDTLGHPVGDRLLVEVARRLRDSVRESDIVARLGGDEFIVVLTGMEAAEDAMAVGAKIHEMLGQPYDLAGHVLHSTPSIGVSLFPSDGEEADILIKHADVAMYHAKQSGRNRLQFFAAELTAAAGERLALEHDLRTALANLANSGLSLHFQPQICAHSGQVYGFEALARWQHPERGWIPPLQFVPIAEEAGLIDQLGAWVLDQACRQLALWRAEGVQNVRMAVNLSAHQLRSPGLTGQVRNTLARHDLNGIDLELEITESVAMADPDQAIEQLRALRELGVQIAIDDFGTGYSSLSYLKLLPIQTLKLDKSFVRDIETDANDATISKATLTLAHSLGLKVVAEGVETSAQRDFLSVHGCDYLQGYLFGHPVPAEECRTQVTAPPISSPP